MQHEIINHQFSLADMLVVAVTVFLLSCVLSMYLSWRKRGHFGD